MNVEKYQHITDAEILENFNRDQDNQWLGLLLQRYTLLLFGVCMKYLKNEDEAKDSVQHIFLKAITELHKYKVSYFKSWIYMVARNHCLMRLRDRQGRLMEDLTENVASVLTEEQFEDRFRQEQKEKALELMSQGLEELSEEQKQCVTLFYLEKRSYQAIADSTGYPLVKVKSHIQNGKRNLKIFLDKKLNHND